MSWHKAVVFLLSGNIVLTYGLQVIESPDQMEPVLIVLIVSSWVLSW